MLVKGPGPGMEVHERALGLFVSRGLEKYSASRESIGKRISTNSLVFTGGQASLDICLSFDCLGLIIWRLEGTCDKETAIRTIASPESKRNLRSVLFIRERILCYDLSRCQQWAQDSDCKIWGCNDFIRFA